jgi:hypothetical protein
MRGFALMYAPGRNTNITSRTLRVDLERRQDQAPRGDLDKLFDKATD